MPLDDYYQNCGTPKPLPKAEAHKVRRRGIENDERKKKQIARNRDMAACGGCRWPRADHDTPNHECQGPLEVMHRVAKGMGGDRNGSRTSTDDLLLGCAWIHQRSKDAVERHGRTWEGSANGPVKFFRRGQLVGEEIRMGRLKRA